MGENKIFNETEGYGTHIFEELRNKFITNHVVPNVRLIETQIPFFSPTQEDIDNRIYIQP